MQTCYLWRQLSCPLSMIRIAPRRARPSWKAQPRLAPARKHYSSSSFRQQQTERDRAALGVFTPKAAVLFVAAGIGLYFYFQHEKANLLKERQKEREAKQVGRAHIGGPFTLTTHDNKPFSEQDLLGKWNLLYFGFTNCPDICPAELDKMGAIIDTLEKLHGPTTTTPATFQPVFISVDPARDTVAQVAQYLADFHPRFTGLTGDYAAIKSICKAFRVYFSTPPPPPDAGNATGGDYLVDHSIYIYLMDPKGEFVEAFGQSSTVDDVVSRVRKEIGLWGTTTATTGQGVST